MSNRRAGLRPRLATANYEELEVASVRSEPVPRREDVLPENHIPADADELELAIAREEAELNHRRQAAQFTERQEHLRNIRRERVMLDVRPLQPRPPTVQRQRPPRPRRSSSPEAEHVNNLNDLRQIRDLQNEANRRTGELGLFERSSGSDSSSGGERSRRSRRKGRKMKSGKFDKVSSHVKCAERWPHAYLASSQCGSQDKTYDNLTIQEFVAGYTTILGLRELASKEREDRTAHLSQLMYLAQIYEWEAVLAFHAAVLQQIERRALRWGDALAISQLEGRTLAGRFLGKETGLRHSASEASVKVSSAATVPPGINLYCAEYNHGTCKDAGDHIGMYRGRKRNLLHVCAECLRRSGKMAKHTMGSSDCPFSTT